MRHVHGGDIYGRGEVLDFSANMNPLGMPETVKQAAQAGAAASEQYPQPYARNLREKIAAYESAKLKSYFEKGLQEQADENLQDRVDEILQDRVDEILQGQADDCKDKGSFITTDQVFVGNGAADLIFLLTRALQPEEGIVFSPSFAEYEAALRAEGSTLSLIPLHEENGFALTRHEIRSMRRHLASKSDNGVSGNTVVFVCQPGNPTGVLIDPERLAELLEICRRFETWLVIDACFVPLLDEEQVRIQEELIAQCLEYERTVVLRAFTKAFAMPGLRLGYLVCRDTSLITRLQEVSQPWSVSLPAMMAGEAALEEAGKNRKECDGIVSEEMPTGYLMCSRAYISTEKQKLLTGLNAMQGGLIHEIYGHAANYIFFRAEPGLFDKLLKQGIMIRDCSNFTSLEPGYYRIAVRTEAENDKLLEVLLSIAQEFAAQREE